MTSAGRIVAFVGPHNSGKTGLVSAVARAANRAGLRVGLLKRAARPLEFEPEGKDSARFARSGATRVITTGPGLLHLTEALAEPPDVRALARRFGRGVDIWLLESYVVEPVPWVRVARKGQEAPPPDRRCIALVGDGRGGGDLPRFRLDHPGSLLRYLQEGTGAGGRHGR